MIADPRCREVFEGQPYIDAVWLLRRGGGPLAQARAWSALIARARRESPDLVLDLYGSKRTALVSRLSGARWRIGLHRQGSSRWYNPLERLSEPLSKQGHLIQRINSAVVAAGISAPFAYCGLPVSEADRAGVSAVLAERGLDSVAHLVVLNPAARVAAKQWPPERFGGLAERLWSRERTRCGVISSPDAPALTEAVVGASQGAAVALPPLALRRLAALLERASLLVSGDTGVLHVGSAMGTPAVILSGPTSPDLVACPACPQVILFDRDACPHWETGSECARYNDCLDRRCIDAITMEETLDAVTDLLGRVEGRR